jgi:hypothetical protein
MDGRFDLSVVPTLWGICVVLTSGQCGLPLTTKINQTTLARASGLHRGRGFQAVFAAFNPSRASTASRITNF